MAGQDQQKELVAQAALAEITFGAGVIGIGSGSTVEIFTRLLAAESKRRGISTSVVCGSYHVERIAREAGLLVLQQSAEYSLVVHVDGCDEIDPQRNLLKGRGAALLREKQLFRMAQKRIAICTADKKVSSLGARALPVQVLPASVSYVQSALAKLGASNVVVRQAGGKDGAVITEEGHLILDAQFKGITATLCDQVKLLTGVVEHGGFFSMVDVAFVGDERLP